MELSGCRANWDFFTVPTGTRQGRIREISTQHAVLCCHEPIETRRWLRVVLHDPQNAIARVAFARVTDHYEMLDLWEDESLTLYRHELEWINPLEPEWAQQLAPDYWELCQCTNLVRKAPGHGQQSLCGLCSLRVMVSEA